MPILRVTDLGAIGIVSDVDPTTLPPGAWTAGKNVRFSDGGVEKFLGHQSFATPSVTPYYLVPTTKSTTLYWVYPGLDKVYSFDGSTHADITRAAGDYTGAAGDLWNGGVLNGVLVLNNGKDAPQMWTGAVLSALTWDATTTWADKGYTAKVIRPYRNFLVALDFNTGTTRYPQTVYWSDRADPLTVPGDWDFADPANEAGQNELASTPGYCIDAEALRDALVIYKDDAIHTMQEVGGKFVHTFREVSKTTGILAQRCAKEFFGKHFVFGNDDCYVHDGQSIESVASRRIRRELYSAIDPTYYTRSFVVRNFSKSEMWCCFHETGSASISRAAVWNWKDGTWGHRELPACPHIGYGVLFDSSDPVSWSADPNSWDSDTTTWDSRAYNPATQKLVAASASDLFEMDATPQFDGVNVTSYIERTGLVLDGLDTVKHVRAIYPRSSAASLQVYIGAQIDFNAGYAWEGPYTFTPSTDSKVDVRSTGRLHAVRFVFPGGTVGDLQGYDLEYTPVGSR
jgi:hypothetical protein